MSPAGSGEHQFRGGLVRFPRRVSVCTWIRPWLLPAGLLGTVALISLSGPLAYLLVGLWGWLVFPYGAAYIREHARSDVRRNAGEGETQYWRTRSM
jgi:hypothetical protein